MAGLRPGHPRLRLDDCKQDVDARHKAGHDELNDEGADLAARLMIQTLGMAATIRFRAVGAP
jgi:hypothetical protein